MTWKIVFLFVKALTMSLVAGSNSMIMERVNTNRDLTMANQIPIIIAYAFLCFLAWRHILSHIS